MDDELYNGLWSAIEISVWSHWGEYRTHGFSCAPLALQQLLKNIWVSFLKRPLDELPKDGGLKAVRDVYFSGEWNEAYDFIEFVLKHGVSFRRGLMNECNSAMERENAGYRVLGEEVTPITNEAEMEAVAAAALTRFANVNIHITRAVELLSDRKDPDYRNSIKEAISAVECVCRVVSKDKKATLGQALKRIGEQQAIHPALEKAFSALYGYASDADGIRHSLINHNEITFTEAKFMVVACSAFVNYLTGKVSELEIKV